MSKENKKTVVKVEKNITDQIKENYKTIEQGTDFILSSFLTLEKRTLNEIKKIYFSENEIKGIADIMNGHLLQAETSGNDFLELAIIDANKYEKLFAKWGFNPSKIINKVRGLTFSQSFFLQHYLNKYWYSKNKNIPIDEYIKPLLPDKKEI